MKLQYRHYMPGDERQISALFNRAFNVIFPQNEKQWKWKYAEKPDFDPESLQICVDTEAVWPGDADIIDEKKEDTINKEVKNGRIIGFIASEIRELINNIDRTSSEQSPRDDSEPANKIIRCGMINDVATDPDYQRKGIARKLLNMAMEYYQKNDVKTIFLSADPKGHPRKKLYIPAEFKDLFMNKVAAGIVDPYKFCFKDVKAAFLLYPFIEIIKLVSVLKRFIFGGPKSIFKKEQSEIDEISGYKSIKIQRDLRIRISHPIKGNTIQNQENGEPNTIRNGIIEEYSEIYGKWSKECYILPEFRPLNFIKWARDDAPFEKYNSTIVILDKFQDGRWNPIIAGAFSIHGSRITKLKLRISTDIAIIHEIIYHPDFIAKSAERGGQEFIRIFSAFINRMYDAMKERGATSFFFFMDPKHALLRKGFALNNALIIPGGVYMAKNLDVLVPSERFEKRDKPLFIPTYDNIGYP